MCVVWLNRLVETEYDALTLSIKIYMGQDSAIIHGLDETASAVRCTQAVHCPEVLTTS